MVMKFMILTKRYLRLWSSRHTGEVPAIQLAGEARELRLLTEVLGKSFRSKSDVI